MPVSVDGVDSLSHCNRGRRSTQVSSGCDHGRVTTPRQPELPSAHVEADLRRRCEAGEWSPGERLPAVAALAEHYGVARNTILKALRRLAEDGLVEVVPNWGTFRK